MVKLIIFDWDDVFTLGSKEGYFKCYNAVLEELKIKLPPEEVKKRILSRWSQSYQSEIAELLKENPELEQKGCEIYLKHLFGNTFIESLHCLSGIRELLQRLHEKYILTLATGVHPLLLREKIIPKFNIPDVFSHIITSQDLTDKTLSKPHPYIAEQLMRLTNTPKEQTVMVGDAENDVLMAKNAGITPIVVLTGHLKKNEAEELGVKYIINNITLLEDVLERL